MTLLIDKQRLIVNPALAPTKPREADEFERRHKATDGVLTLGLINNMPDAGRPCASFLATPQHLLIQ